MKARKIIAMFLGVIIAVNAVPQVIITKAEESKVESEIVSDSFDMLEEKAVTDLSQYEDNELIIIYQDGTTKKEKQQALDNVETEEQKNVTEWCDKIVLKDKDDLEQAVESLAENEDIAYIQPNFKYSAMSTVSSSDDVVNITEDEFKKQWWIYNDGTFEEPEDMNFDSFWSLYDRLFWPFEANVNMFSPIEDIIKSRTIKAVAGIDTNTAKAWQQFTDGGRKTIVAVIDTGMDYNHSQLKDSMWINSGEIPGNGIDDDGNGYIDDIYGWDFYYNSNEVYVGTSKMHGRSEDEDEHGTHVAGVIAAAQDGIGTVGIASNVNIELMSLKVLGQDGSGETEDIVKAIEYAEKQGAVICNMSFGINQSDLPFYYQTYDQAMKTAIKNSSMLFVAAAGNDGMNNDSYGVYPSSYEFDNIISVGMLCCDGTLSDYSNYGAKTVDLAAPGSYIYSTLPNDQYGYESGTSMATPMVTAACAMAYAYAKVPDVLAIRERILANVTVLSSLSGKVATSGMLNIYDSVRDLADNEYRYTKTITEEENTQQETTEDINQNQTTQNTSTINQPETDQNTTESTNTNSFVGQKFISDGIIYKVLTEKTAAVFAVVNIDKKITIAPTVVFDSVTYKITKIRTKAFYKNLYIQTVKIGKNVKNIGKGAFLGCKNLKKVTGMKSVQKVKKNAFKNCTKLKSIKLTEKATAIASSAFSGCKNLAINTIKESYAVKYAKQHGISVSY